MAFVTNMRYAQASFLSHVIPSSAESVGRERSKIIYGHGQSLDFVAAFSCDVFFAFSAIPSDLFVKCHFFGSGVRTTRHPQIFSLRHKGRTFV